MDSARPAPMTLVLLAAGLVLDSLVPLGLAAGIELLLAAGRVPKQP
jgi:hypothetical protein